MKANTKTVKAAHCRQFVHRFSGVVSDKIEDKGDAKLIEITADAD